MHKNLKEDLIRNNLPDNCIILFHDKKSLINEIITPYLQKIAIEQLKQGKLEQFDFNKWFEDNHEEFIAHLDEDIESIFGGEFDNPELVFIEDPDEFIVEKAYELGDGKVYLDVALKATLSIDMFIPKYHDIPKGYSLLIWDSDWNKHYMFGSFSIKLPIHLSIIFNIFTQEVEDFEINTIGEVYGLCKNCGEPILSDTAENCSNCGESLIDD